MAEIFSGLNASLMRDNPTPEENMDRAAQLNAHLSSIAANAFMNAQERAIKEKSELQTRAGFVELGNYLSGVTDWADPKAEAGAWSIVAKNPWVAKSPMFPHVMENFKASRMAKEAQASREFIAADRNLALADIAAAKSADFYNQLDAKSQAAIDLANEKVRLGITPTADERIFLKQMGIEAQSANIEQRHQAKLDEDAARIALESTGIRPDQVQTIGGSTFIKTAKGGLHAVNLFTANEIEENRADRKEIAMANKTLSDLTDPASRQQWEVRRTALQGRLAKRLNDATARLKNDVVRIGVVPAPAPSVETAPVPATTSPVPEVIPSTAPPDATGGVLTEEQEAAFLKAAGGDKAKAGELARQAGYTASQGEVRPAMRQNLLPLPKTKAELVEGELYDTAKGPAVWTGTVFQP